MFMKSLDIFKGFVKVMWLIDKYFRLFFVFMK